MLVVKVSPGDASNPRLRARLMTIQYGASTPIAFGANLLEATSRSAPTGGPDTLDQLFRIGVGLSRQVVSARYAAQQGSTRIVVEGPQPQSVIVKPGLDLLQMVTAGGHLSIQY